MNDSRALKSALIIPAFNEGRRCADVVRRVPAGAVDGIVVVNDCSSDDTAQAVAETARATVLHNPVRQGIGFAIRQGLTYALDRKFGLIVIMAGNGKDDPQEIPRLVRPVRDGAADFVQGSRYLSGGGHDKTPMHRLLFTRGYSTLLRMAFGFRVTDATNGFRAFRAGILRNPAINLNQPWLRDCLEYYLTIKIRQLGYRVAEVPVTKTYPADTPYAGYTKIKPFTGWVMRLRPLVYLRLGLKR